MLQRVKILVTGTVFLSALALPFVTFSQARAEPVSLADGLYTKGSTKYSNGRHIAFDSKGRLHAVYTQKGDGVQGNPGQYAWSDDNGQTWTVGLADLDQGTALDAAWGNFTPAIAVGSDDSVHIVYYAAHKEARSKAIWYLKSSDRGTSWSTATAITDGMPAAVYVWPSLVLDKANSPHVAFTDQSSMNAYYTALDAQGRWKAGVKVNGTSKPKDVAALLYNPGLGTQGAFFVAFDEGKANGSIKVNRSDDMGASWTGLATPITFGGSGRCLWPSLTSDAQGNTYMSVTLTSGSVYKIIVIKRDAEGQWTKPSIDNLFPGAVVKGYMRSSLAIDESNKLHVVVEGSAQSRANWNIWQTSASTSDLNTWSAPRRISDSQTGDNAFASIPAVVKGLSYLPILWTHGDISDAETGHLSDALPGNGRTKVMFSGL